MEFPDCMGYAGSLSEMENGREEQGRELLFLSATCYYLTVGEQHTQLFVRTEIHG